MQRKRGYTVIEFIVVAAILLTIISLLWPAVSAARSAAKRNSDGGERGPSQPPQSWNLYTAQHDGHWFVKDTGGGVCHHPDCPCLSRKAESEGH